ncbi:pentatricopeptide repeat-containing protein At2g41080 isoform X2 [Sesamum indicum]|uniref:Pentatricopeptide repeat-containing protein At2g41080 isoform X2 n=1 Tax=Sesamum indicum TaxID=4182 RepID=A0A6I9TG73_SESIN|nr:pentatricopeptide repeat-containing protein At2g41080 isoform X2 [Sesamum indicum]
MAAVQKLYNTCKASLTPNGPISEEGLEKVRNLLDPLLLSDLLKACVEHRSPSLAQQLHSIIITRDWLKLKFVSNHLVNTYAKLGHVEAALKVFDKMPERNVMSYNILIGGYIQNGELGAAIEVFKEMGRRNSATWNAVIMGLIKSEFNEEALRLFTKMHVNGFLPDAYTLGSVLRGCAGLRDLIKGKQVHGYAIRSGLEMDLVVGSSMAHMYMRCGILREGQRVIQSMPVHNVVACNTLIAGLVQNGCAMGALDQYYIMKIAGFQPDKITFVSVISSCSELSTLGQGQQIHAEVIKAGAMSVAAVISSLISMYSRCGCLDDAVRVFGERGRAEDDLVLWSSMIAAYGFHGKGEEAIELFNRMKCDGLEANEVTFLSLLYSCSHCGLKDKGLEFFDMMVKKYGFEPHVKHCTCVVDLLGRAGCLHEAEAFIRSMPVEPDAITWKTLLSACKIHKNADMAKRIVEEILKIDPQDSASYVLLSNTQACAERWQDVSDVRRKMRERMVKKEPGISWFELKNQVYHFVMGDKSHPNSEDIDSYLQELMAELKSLGYAPDIGAVLHDMDVEEKEYNLVHHSEKLAVAFALMNTPDGVPIRIMKNLRVCDDCHVAMKYISVVKNREIIVRDSSRFHHFKNGYCSCGDYW